MLRQTTAWVVVGMLPWIKKYHFNGQRKYVTPRIYKFTVYCTKWFIKTPRMGTCITSYSVGTAWITWKRMGTCFFPIPPFFLYPTIFFANTLPETFITRVDLYWGLLCCKRVCLYSSCTIYNCTSISLECYNYILWKYLPNNLLKRTSLGQ